MRRFLPYFFAFLLIISAFFIFKPSVFAADTTTPTIGTWVNDSDVTFVGKVAARSGQFLDWTLSSPNWSTVGPNQISPIAQFWTQIRNIVYAFCALFILITAFILIVSRGKSMTIGRFIPRFILILLLVTFSFAIIQFIYQICDIIQGFFLRNPDPASVAKHVYIWQGNLLNVGFDYEKFVGYRLYGAIYDESAFMSLLLVKLTSATYYTMAGILLIRKIILWFFIIVSPIFPLLLLYSPIRNTAKIWVGEFFRWLLYGPLFAIFLSGLVAIWRSGVGIPLSFNFTNANAANCDPTAAPYVTAINILVGGPGQKLALCNSVNYVDTFAQYVVALLMLWVVIILPFLLLQIFLDYLNTVSLNENSAIRQFISNGSSLFKGSANPPPPPPPLPSSSQPAGMARAIPFSAKIEIPEIRTQKITVDRESLKSVQTELSRLTNLSVPTMRDIARFETASMSHDVRQHGEIAKYHEALEHLADPRKIGAPIERQKYTELKNKLVQEGQRGNQFANSVLTAAEAVAKPGSLTEIQKENTRLTTILSQIANPNSAPLEQKQKMLNLKTQLEKASQGGVVLATSITSAMQKGEMDEGLKQKIKEAKQTGNSIASEIITNAEQVDLTKLDISHLTEEQKENTKLTTVFGQIADPNSAPLEQKQKLLSLKGRLEKASQEGDPLAASITSAIQKGEVDETLKQKLKKAKETGHSIATEILNSAEQVDISKVSTGLFPVINRVQSVNLDDYEAVRKMWQENYQNMEPPKSFDSKVKGRKDWVSTDISKINQTIEQLTSTDPANVNKGMESVGNILPFLLIGGFSQTEVIAYLKAKLEAAKSVLSDLGKKEEEEETTLGRETAKTEKPKEMTTSAEEKTDDKN